jgi:hypothetical protein
MIRIALIGAAAAGLLLSGCEDTYGYGYDRGYNSYGNSYDVWYDGYYGPYSDGYWNGDAFYYSDGRGGYVVDQGGHYRRQRFDGSRRYHWRPR